MPQPDRPLLCGFLGLRGSGLTVAERDGIVRMGFGPGALQNILSSAKWPPG